MTSYHTSRRLEAVIHDRVLLGREERREFLGSEHLLSHGGGDAHLLFNAQGGLAQCALIDRDSGGGYRGGGGGDSLGSGLGRCVCEGGGRK